MAYVLRDCNATLPQELIEIKKVLDTVPKCIYSVVGGCTRDILLGSHINDIDICYINDRSLHKLRDALGEAFVIWNTRPHPNVRDIVVINGKEVLVDWIRTDYIYGPYPPSIFDFSVNEVALFPDLVIHAQPRVWLDIDMRLLRLNNGRTVTTKTAMRACRFAAKCKLRPVKNTIDTISIAMSSKGSNLNQYTLLEQLKKTMVDDVKEEVWELMDMFHIHKLGHSDFDSLFESLLDLSQRNILIHGDEPKPEEGY